MTISKVRRFVPVALVVVGVAMLVGAFAAWRLAPSQSTDRLPDLGPGTSGMVGWSLAAGGGPGSPPKVAPDATVLLVRTNWWPACSPWDANDSWLTQEISYLPWSVTITLHESDSFAPVKCQGFYDYWGQPLEVHLREPLGGRPLFDGSKSPPDPRPIPEGRGAVLGPLRGAEKPSMAPIVCCEPQTGLDAKWDPLGRA